MAQSPRALPPGDGDGDGERLGAPPSPHELQREALVALAGAREQGRRRALVVLATGLGKTWLAAFDVQSFAQSARRWPRVLFLAHREELLAQAARTFRRLLVAARQPAHVGWCAGDLMQPDADSADEGDILGMFDDFVAYRADLGVGIQKGRLVPFAYHGVRDDIDYAELPWRNRRFEPAALALSSPCDITPTAAEPAPSTLTPSSSRRVVLGGCRHDIERHLTGFCWRGPLVPAVLARCPPAFAALHLCSPLNPPRPKSGLVQAPLWAIR